MCLFSRALAGSGGQGFTGLTPQSGLLLLVSHMCKLTFTEVGTAMRSSLISDLCPSVSLSYSFSVVTCIAFLVGC